MSIANDPTPPGPGKHSSPGMGAAYAIAAQVNNVDAINQLIITTTLLVASLAKNVETAITQMNTTLTADQTEESNFYQEFAVDPSGGSGGGPGLQAWIAIYSQPQAILDKLFPGAIQCASDPGEAHLFWQGEHSTLAQSMNVFQETYNADQLMGQANLAAAQRPVDLWNQTVSDQNKSTATDYKLCQALLSIMKNLSIQINV